MILGPSAAAVFPVCCTMLTGCVATNTCLPLVMLLFLSVSTADVAVRLQVLSKIRGTNDVDEEFADITEAARISNLAPHPMRNLFKPQYRPQLTISLLFMMFQQFTGINAIIFYAPVLFNSIGSGHTASLLNTVIIGAGMLSWLVHCACIPGTYCASHRSCCCASHRSCCLQIGGHLCGAFYVACGLTSCHLSRSCCMWHSWLDWFNAEDSPTVIVTVSDVSGVCLD